ncbi:STAS domain-containing protein [Seonamhaeicola marinus]|uniref:STAS domain-containing protein n=1 Tax=Seonamhaeicola marinus TaxID=1912246 RepID=A0A5D0I531_9FLAO|nr:STAS domain-containing protein [Seonamhaeicola marinus]TYA78478.1 hypothetical protein FUA24_08965 [Seonamhaeicola marinus]
MSVTVKNKNGIMHAKGVLNSSSFVQFQSILQKSFKSQNSILLNLDKINSIDSNGILVLYKIYKKAKIHNKEFKILGSKSSFIYNQIAL